MLLHLGDDPAGLRPATGPIAEVRVIPTNFLRRPTDGALEQVRDAVVQHLVGRKPDGVLEAFRFQKLINLGRGEGGVTTEITPECLVPVSSDHRVQHIAPFMGAVHVARTQGATLQIAELVEHEQRVIARAAEVTIVGRALPGHRRSG